MPAPPTDRALIQAQCVRSGADHDGDIWIAMDGQCGCCRMIGYLNFEQAETLIAALMLQLAGARRIKSAMPAPAQGTA